MTDTVNVERAWVDRFIAWVESFTGTAPEGTVDEMFSLYTDARRFALAAAQSSELLVAVSIVSRLLENSVAHYGHPKDEDSGVGATHKEAREFIAKNKGPQS